MDVGLIGLGVMGTKAAEKILQGGHSLAVFDIGPGTAERARALGARAVGSAREAASLADVVLMFLPGPEQVQSCVTGPAGLLDGARAGTIVADMSTVDPGTSARMAEAAAANGVGYLDAPVLGRPGSVGNWALPVGGDAGSLERCRCVLDLLAARIFHIGPPGAGNRVKLLNQMMFGAINAATAEMMALSAKMGIPPKVLFETIASSNAATVSNLFKELGRRIAEEEYGDPTFTVDLLSKDVRLAVRMAGENGSPAVFIRAVETMNELAQARGLGRADTASMWKIYEGIWG